MIDRAHEEVRAAPAVDNSARLTGAGRLVVLAFGLVGVAIGFAIIQRDRAEPFVLWLLGVPLSLVLLLMLFGVL